MSGWCSRTHAATVPLPTAVGPARTIRNACRSEPSLTIRELGHERRDLVGAEPAYATALGDTDAFHQLAGFDLAEAGNRRPEVEDLHLADDLVALTLAQDLRQRCAGMLEAVLEPGARAACGSGCVERRLALLGGQRRKSQLGHLGV